MNLEDMMLSETSQSHEDKYLQEVPRMVKPIEAEGRMVVVKGWGLWGEMTDNGYRVSLWDDENVLQLDSRDGCKPLWMY